jgi:hypothetical protein
LLAWVDVASQVSFLAVRILPPMVLIEEICILSSVGHTPYALEFCEALLVFIVADLLGCFFGLGAELSQTDRGQGDQ